MEGIFWLITTTLRHIMLDQNSLQARIAELAVRHALVLVTANTARLPAESVELLARRDAPVLPKPCDVDALVALVREIAERPKHAVAPAVLVC